MHWVQALRGKSTLFTQDEALQVLGRARSVLDAPCECTGDPGTYEYRGDKRQHCMWCDGLREGQL
jgi:hypothetical protein